MVEVKRALVRAKLKKKPRRLKLFWQTYLVIIMLESLNQQELSKTPNLMMEAGVK